VVVAALAALVLAAGASYWLFFVRPAARTEAPPPPRDPEGLRVVSVSGGVEIAGPDGSLRPAAVGAVLGPRDRVTTTDDGSAELRGSDGSAVRLLGATSVRVGALRRELARLRLAQGMVEAEVPDDPARVFELELDDIPDGGAGPATGVGVGDGGAIASNGAVARTRGARFIASTNGAGSAAVASRRGEVVLSARGREVVIRAGQVARVRPGAPPEAPTPIPGSLFLKVAWPPAATSQRRVIVDGATRQGARVQVNGRYVPVDEQGRYRATLDLPDGTHPLSVKAIDVTGDVATEAHQVVVDTKTQFKVQKPKWK
jgi:hypothetical protein